MSWCVISCVFITIVCFQLFNDFFIQSWRWPQLIHFQFTQRYFILFISIIQMFIALYTMSSRGGTEAFVSLWSAAVLLMLCVGGTVIMRKFQSSVAVGFFMGSVVAASQMFFLIFLMWVCLVSFSQLFTWLIFCHWHLSPLTHTISLLGKWRDITHHKYWPFCIPLRKQITINNQAIWIHWRSSRKWNVSWRRKTQRICLPCAITTFGFLRGYLGSS